MQGTKVRWILPTPMPSGYEAGLKHLSPVVAQILYNRGITLDELPGFLHPGAAAMHPPLLMRGMAEAVCRIRAAISGGEAIVVYGDFDADGITGTVLLHQVLATLGADCRVYVPHRTSEGYGLNVNAIDRLRADGARLIITVDCGISSVAEVDHARSQGIDVIITDHHLPPAQLPRALTILNPRQPLCTYPFKDLSGAGVAFKLSSALLEGVPHGNRRRQELLDLVAVGTVSDMVPLRGENRVLVRYGLPLLTHTTRLGLRALMLRAGLADTTLTTADIGFQIGPRLNAAGRLDHAMVGCRLLMTTDPVEAEALAEELEEQNNARKHRTAAIIGEARARLGPQPRDRIIVVDDPTWAAGVIGLVAGRLADEYSRPTFVIERTADESRGSARSIPGFNLATALAACHDLLTKYGGHAQAAGFSLPTAHLPAFAARLRAIGATQLRDEDLVPTIEIDAEVGGRDFDVAALNALHEQLAVLEPFGNGNPPPILLWRNLRIKSCRFVGENRHLRMTLETPRGTVNAIAFGQAEEIGLLAHGTAIDIVCSLQYNEWNGYAEVELRVKDTAVKGDGMRH